MMAAESLPLNDIPARFSRAKNNPDSSDWAGLSRVFDTLPEATQWKILRAAIAARKELGADAVRAMSEQMQGCYFVEPWVQHRSARICYAADSGHSIHLRIAAGSNQVWFDDEEFGELLLNRELRDLACFARCPEMRPHHLMLVEHLLKTEPLCGDGLPTAYEAAIALKKSLEKHGHTIESHWFRSPLRKMSRAIGRDKRSIKALWLSYMDSGISVRQPKRSNESPSLSSLQAHTRIH
jgi:hypothetical protein